MTGFSASYICEVTFDECVPSVGYADSYAPRHDMLNVVLLGAHFSSIIASFPVPRHDTFNAASLGAVCCDAALLKKSNTSYSCMCYTRKRKAEDLIVRACQILCMWFYWRHKGLIMSR